MRRGFDKLSQNGLNQLSEQYWTETLSPAPHRGAFLGVSFSCALVWRT